MSFKFEAEVRTAQGKGASRRLRGWQRRKSESTSDSASPN